MYIDTHTHFIDEEEYQTEITNALNLGVKELILVCTNEAEKDRALKYRSDVVKLAYGIYPNDKNEIDEKELEKLDLLMSDDTFIALGEIGLDYHYYKDNKECAKELLIRQIEIANKRNKPIIIHTRESIGDIYEILKKYDNKRKGVIHCFTGSLEMAKSFIKLGYYISFGGVLTFKNSINVKESLKGIDLNYVLFETDAPYLTPVPFRGKVNHTYYVKYVYEYAAELLGIELKELQKIVYQNYLRLFYGKD